MRDLDFANGNAATAPTRRRLPLQARGQATVAAILDATASLIATVGHDAVTTNHIANASGINIATLYQYFSNKQAIVIALFERQSDARHVAAIGALDAAVGADWQTRLGAAIAAAAGVRSGERGAAAVHRAVCANPELRACNREWSDRTATVLGRALAPSFPLVATARLTSIVAAALEIPAAFEVDDLDAGSDVAARIADARLAAVAWIEAALGRQPVAA